MSETQRQARADLQNWQESQPSNVYTANPQLERLLAHHLGAAGLAAARPHLERFGGLVMSKLDPAAIVGNRPWNLPRLDRWSAIGERQEAIEHHPSHGTCGEAIYEDGRVIAVYENPASNTLAQALFYLSSHAGEAGHNCPVACTAGVVKALQAVGSDELKSRWLPGLLSDRFAERLDGAQFLTEVQGGSDVGANDVRATADGEALGTTRWRITGEKWFCSNADADLILMTARVDRVGSGTRGLGLFLVPRLLEDGSVNHFAFRRLKDKLGTRSMASAEIDFEGAVGYAVGPVDAGFKTVMHHVINTSRLYNSLGCTGIAQRAYTIADAYARRRRAFGHPILGYPQVQEMMANMRSTVMALLAGCLELAAGADAAELGTLDDDGLAFLRVTTNLVKLSSCQHSHRAVLTGIETLGGNGAIESFSVLPRLLRDNVVYENWEGTHNTLVAQTMRDFARLGLHEPVFARLEALLDVDDEGLRDAIAPARDALARASIGVGEALSAASDPGLAALILKPHAEALANLFLAACLAQDVARETDESLRSEETDVVRWFVDRHLGLSAAKRDQAYGSRAARISRA
jgi:alkylation response protein AidB-like acyl-CoA dehydrogenase